MNEPCYYRVSVKALVINETGRFLLARQDDGKWELLGGGLEHGEDPIIGLKREVNEEAGLEITEISPTPKYFITSPKLRPNTFSANVIYEVKFKDMDFTPSGECEELRYVTVDEAEKLDLLPNVREFIQRFDIDLHIS